MKILLLINRLKQYLKKYLLDETKKFIRDENGNHIQGD
jgi:hypothetical protein